LGRPITPKDRPGDTYVVCFDCGRHLAYDAKAMQLGKPIDPPR